MEVASAMLEHEGFAKEEIKRAETIGGDEEKAYGEVVIKIGKGKQHHESASDKKPCSPPRKDSSCSNQAPAAIKAANSLMERDFIASSSNRKEQDDQLESARAEMGEVREENQRLKMCLDRIMKDYQTLQTKFYDVVQQDGKKPVNTSTSNPQQEAEESELVSLTLGRFQGERKKSENSKISDQGKEDKQVKQDLVLGLDCKFEASKLGETAKPSPDQSPTNSLEGREEAGETWPPSKVLKTVRSGDQDEVSQQNPPKKARVCVRVRCDTPTMNDGCQWRKYGQKIAKGNPCPRAYYRCTGAPSCPVRKQVQRCAEDKSILITTYEGTHNHPLPVAATVMASTTSAAASMLLSGSSSSRADSNISVPAAGTTVANLQGLSFCVSDNSNSKQFYLPNSSLSSSAQTHPTITLDLTTNPSSSASSHSFNKFSSGYPPRYPFTSLDFGTSQSNVMSWSNGLLGYGSNQQAYPARSNPIDLSRQPLQNMIYQNYLQKNNPATAMPSAPQHQPLQETIAAATKVITADPNFQSALAAALSSIIGGGTSGSGVGIGGGMAAATPGGGEGFLGQKLKWGEVFPSISSGTFTTSSKGNGCASSLLNKTGPTNSHQPGSLMFLPSNSLPFSNSKSTSTSPADHNRDHSS